MPTHSLMVTEPVPEFRPSTTPQAAVTRRIRIALFAILVLAPVLLRSGVEEWSGSPAAGVSGAQAATTPNTFTFAAAGDLGANSGLAAYNRLDSSGVDFFLALGDLDYDQTPTDEAWCDYVKQHLPTLGPEFPFELLVGSHEDQDAGHGYILNHAACLPDKLGVTGMYGVEYYFDYPASSPLIRVIMIPPDMRVENVLYNYTPDSPHYAWLSSTIDSARASGIPWVAVGMHDVCLTAGIKTCQIGADLMNLLINKRVDLVLQGHDHNYQRSKQLRLKAGVCAAVPVGAYAPSCVVDSGADGIYAKGAGPIFVISGSFGLCCYAVNSADPEAPYFARMNSTTRGFTEYTVGPGHIEANFVNSLGTFTDSFSIVSNFDSDADGFTNGVESYAGTNPTLACGVDAWPADINNDGFSDIFDIVPLTNNFGVSVPPAPARHNISPDRPDGFVDIFDIVRMANTFAKSCR
jgi:Calcineurin-like phosphoesterase